MRSRPRKPGTFDPKSFRAAVERLRAVMATCDKDASWADDLPEAPDLPTAPDEVVAVVIPRRGGTSTRRGGGR